MTMAPGSSKSVCRPRRRRRLAPRRGALDLALYFQLLQACVRGECGVQYEALPLDVGKITWRQISHEEQPFLPLFLPSRIDGCDCLRQSRLGQEHLPALTRVQ